MNLYEVAEEIGRRLFKIFLKDEQGNRPVHGTARKFQEDPHWRDYPYSMNTTTGTVAWGLARATRRMVGAIARIAHLFASVKASEMIEQSKEKNGGRGPEPGARDEKSTCGYG